MSVHEMSPEEEAAWRKAQFKREVEGARRQKEAAYEAWRGAIGRWEVYAAKYRAEYGEEP